MEDRLNLALLLGLSLLGLPLLGSGCARVDPAPPQPEDPALEARRRFLASPHPERAERPPNLVLILADDLGRADLSIYNGQWIPTPHIDALGAAGVVFEDATVTSPICAPSRAGLLTGRYQQRFGFEHITHGRHPQSGLERVAMSALVEGDGWELSQAWEQTTRDAQAREGLPPGEITLAEVLARRGYATAIFGKWHLGVAPDQRPTRRGFQTQYGFYEAHSLYADPDRADIQNLRLEHFADRHQWRVGREGSSAIFRDDQEIVEERYLTTALAEESSAWIAANRDRPFFLYLPLSTPHAPFQAPRAVYDAIDEPDPERRMYAAMLRTLDDAVGQVLGALDEAGVAEDTLVVLLSDNGGATYTHIADNSPWKGGKFTHLEGGLRVPMLARWPGRLPAGLRYGEAVSALDVFATLTDAADAELPTDRPYDGVSLLPYLRGEGEGSPHPALYWRAGSAAAIREGRYKLLLDALTGDEALYDLQADPYETTDLAAHAPEQVARLRQALATWETQLMDPLWPPIMQYRLSDGENTWVFPL